MDCNLPDHVSYTKFVSYRVKELKLLEQELSECEHGARAYQRLPRHMQRRAVSTNPKRLPIKIREKNRREIGDKKKESKRPCRKYRRRSSNIVQEHNRRAKNSHWLETHVWHAKRFHINCLWEHSIPDRPTNKGHRATLRAARTALMQDISYEAVLEICGNADIINRAIHPYLNHEDFNSFSSHASVPLSWSEIFLHQKNRYPYGAIGRLPFYWHPQNSEIRTVWFWTHPSIYKEVLSTFIEAFHLVADNEFEYKSSDIALTDLKGKLNAFKLIGPSAYSVLSKVLIPSIVDKGEGWWKSHFSSDKNLESNQKFVDYWKLCSKFIPDTKVTMGLVVRDPRMISPPQKRFHDPIDEPNVIEPPEVDTPFLPILVNSIRDFVLLNLPSTKSIDEMRSSNVVPGSELPIEDNESRIPVLLMFEPPGRFSEPSWTIVLPSQLGKMTWVALYLNGGIAAGFSQMKILKKELILPPQSYEYPDTTCGREYNIKQSQENKDSYFKKPPQCRLNYLKLGIRFPFGVEWLKLMQSFNPSAIDFYVLRDQKYLSYLNKITWPVNSNVVKSNLDSFVNNGNAILYVRLIMYDQGTCEENAMICMPTDQDLLQRCTASKDIILEPSHVDNNIEARTQLKFKHAKEKKRKRRLTKTHKAYIEKMENGDPSKANGLKTSVAPKIQEMIEYGEFNNKMQDLWIPSSNDPVQHCSRVVIGYVSDGGHVNSIGRCGGLGWIILEPLLKLLAKINLVKSSSVNSVCDLKRVMILVRNPSCLVYRWARLMVIEGPSTKLQQSLEKMDTL